LSGGAWKRNGLVRSVKLSLKISKYWPLTAAVIFQLALGYLDHRLGGEARSISLYAIPVFGVALYFSYPLSLTFATGTSIIYLLAGGLDDWQISLNETLDVIFLLGVAVLLSKLVEEHRSVRQIAVHDALTRLYNHAFIVSEVDREVERSHRYGRAMALLMIDIDHFKDYNDTYGHQQGDIVLRETGYILKSQVRATDTVGRYGGEEFAVVLPETNLVQGKLVGERLRSALATHSSKHKGIMRTIYISVGVATCTPGTRSAEMIFEQADQALYEAKRRGRDQVVAFTPGMESLPPESQGATHGRRSSDHSADSG